MNASPLLILALEARLNAGRDIFSQHKRVERVPLSKGVQHNADRRINTL